MATYQIGDIDNVNPASGNLYLDLPLLSYPQLGHSLRLTFRVYSNDKNWFIYNYPQQRDSYGNPEGPAFWSSGDTSGPVNQSFTANGVYIARDQHVDFGTQNNPVVVSETEDDNGGGGYTFTTNLRSAFVRESNGALHYYTLEQDEQCSQYGGGTCPSTAPYTSAAYPASDSSGFALSKDQNYLIAGPDGVKYTFNSQTLLDAIADPSGNTIKTTSTGWVDSVGRTIPGSSSGPGNATGINYENGILYSSAELIPGVSESLSSLCPSGSIASRIWTVPSVGTNATVTYHLCYSQLNWQTSFNAAQVLNNSAYSVVQEASGSSQVLSAIILPNQQSYQFAYDSYGSLSQLTLPTGGTVAYVWQTVVPSGALTASTPLTRSLKSRTINPGNGQPSRTWNYQWFFMPTAQQYVKQYVGIITDPAGNDMERYISSSGVTSMRAYAGCSPDDTAASRTCNTSSSALLRQEDYTLTATGSPWGTGSPAGIAVSLQATPTTVTVTVPTSNGNVVSQTVTTLTPSYGSCTEYNVPTGPGQYAVSSTNNPNCLFYTSPSVVTSSDYGAPGSGQPGPVLSTKTTSYKFQTTPSFLSANLFTLPDTVTLSGASQAQTQYGYDNQGDHTSTIQGVGGDQATTTTPYNSQGMPTQTTDPAGNVTKFTYDGTGLFLQAVQRPSTGAVQHIDRYTFDSNTGRILTHTDENNKQTIYSYSDPVTGALDSLNRVRRITYPPTLDGTSTTPTQGYTQFNYTDTPGSLAVQKQELLSSTAGSLLSSTTFYDGVGDAIKTSLDSDPQGAILVSTNYDSMGRRSTVSNPYRTTTGQTGLNTYTYNDGLGRVTSLSQPDGSTQLWSYNGPTTSFTDESGNTWARTTDGLGRLNSVIEPNQAVTTYSYDVSNNLTLVTQGTGTPPSSPCTRTAGILQRCFGYDSLSRLTSSNNPESGVTGYTYSETGSRCAGDVSVPCSKTDARGRTTTYTYDPLNRMTSNFAPGAYAASKGLTTCFLYDTNGGSAVPNGSGRLTAEWTQTATCPSQVPASGYFSLKQFSSYDARGRALTEQMQTCSFSECAAVRSQTYTYNLAGDQESYTDGLGLNTFTQGYDAAERFQSLTSSYVDSAHPSNLFTVNSFGPVGWTSATMGSAATVAQTFDNRNRVTTHNVTAGVQ